VLIAWRFAPSRQRGRRSRTVSGPRRGRDRRSRQLTAAPTNQCENRCETGLRWRRCSGQCVAALGEAGWVGGLPAAVMFRATGTRPRRPLWHRLRPLGRRERVIATSGSASRWSVHTKRFTADPNGTAEACSRSASNPHLGAPRSPELRKFRVSAMAVFWRPLPVSALIRSGAGMGYGSTPESATTAGRTTSSTSSTGSPSRPAAARSPNARLYAQISTTPPFNVGWLASHSSGRRMPDADSNRYASSPERCLRLSRILPSASNILAGQRHLSFCTAGLQLIKR
jgi:hypothetical protein